MSEKLKVVELFAGVGGFRLGLEGFNGKSASSNYRNNFKTGYEIVWSNQWEPSSKRPGTQQEANMVYQRNWKNSNNSIHNNDDLNNSASQDMTDNMVRNNIPEHDL